MSFTVPISGVPTDLSFAVSTNMVAVGTYLATIDLVDVEQKKAVVVKDCSGTQAGNLPLPQVLTFSLDGKDRLITAFDDQSIVIYDVGRGLKKIRKFQNQTEGSVSNSILVINDHVFALGGVDGEVKTWDDRVGSNCVMEVKAGADQVSQMILSPDENSIFCAMGDGKLSTIKIRGGVVSESETYDTSFSALGTYRDNTKLAVGGENGRIYIFDYGKFSYHSDMFKPHKSAINAMIPITEQIGILGHEDGSVRAFNFFPHKPVGIVGQHPSMVEHMDISSDGRTLVTTAHEEEIRFWDIGFLEDVKANLKEVVESNKKPKHLPSSNKQNSSEFFSGLNEEEEEC